MGSLRYPIHLNFENFPTTTLQILSQDGSTLEENVIQTVVPSSAVEIHLPDGRALCGPRGVPVETFLRAIADEQKAPIVGAIINSELRELTYPITMEALVQPVTMADPDGARIYRRSLTFLLQAAFEDLNPAAVLTVDHSVTSGGFFCHVQGLSSISQDDLNSLKKHMMAMVEADLPLERRKVPLQEAIEFFQKKGQTDKVHLMKYRQKNHLILYRLDDHQDYHHGYMVPSTGYLKWFDLTQMGNGFVLRYPRRSTPTQLMPLPESKKLLATFQLYGNWLNRLGIESIAMLNDTIQSGRVREIILVTEALHEHNIAEIAEQIANHHTQKRIVLIAGPSSSGKTTFSKRLAVQLLAQGVTPYAIELDNYFVNRDQTPLDENGQIDYETLHALNIDLLNDQLKRLIAGEEVILPHYNFLTGCSEPGEPVRINQDQLLILEGIHGLNPGLIPAIPADSTFRVYVSCLTQLNLDHYNRISTTDTRLIRRIVRDARERGYSAQQTIGRWESVRRGEKRHIFPYQDNADEMFNSALVYELSALKPLVEPLLRQVPYGTTEYIEAKRLLTFMDWFLPLDAELIPDNSLLREFIGGSILKDFKLWENPSFIHEQS
jgi:uridine kinase